MESILNDVKNILSDVQTLGKLIIALYLSMVLYFTFKKA